MQYRKLAVTLLYCISFAISQMLFPYCLSPEDGQEWRLREALYPGVKGFPSQVYL